MTLREALFAAALFCGAAAIVYGASLVYVPLAWVLGGLLFGGWSWTVLSR